MVMASTASYAQTVRAPPTSPDTPQPIVYRHPNSGFLGKGFFALLGAYFPSMIVAVVNDNSYDRRLYIPVFGPWLDLADRPGCGGAGQSTCGAETGYKAFLVLSGAVQGGGAALIVLGLALPERRLPAPPPKTESMIVHVLPAAMGRGGYGMSAFGTF